jgi:aerobic carbon-monoxide dehydrogenase small subunit
VALSEVTFTVNGKERSLAVSPDELLVQVLRDRLDLTGTVVGCDSARCGSCTVLLNGSPVKSCTVPANQLDGDDIQTVEGLSDGDRLHPMQEAFLRHGAVQCGYCIPGMLMAAIGMLNANGPELDAAIIREGISGNICRCTGYASIVAAIADGARASKRPRSQSGAQ